MKVSIKTCLCIMSLALAATVGACSPSSAAVSPGSLASLSARQVVQRYYAYVGSHDVRDAILLVAPEIASSAGSYIGNVRSLSNIVVTQPANIRLNNNYQSEVQVVVNYTAQYKRVITGYSGPQIRFVYLGRNAPSQPWKIIAIGTGP